MKTQTNVVAFLTVLAILVSACSGSSSDPPVENGVVVLAQNGYQPGRVELGNPDFGTVPNPVTRVAGPPVDGAVPLAIIFTFTNKSDKELIIGAVEVKNTVGSAFSLGGGCDGTVLRPREANECVVDVSFTPPGPGSYGGLLRLHISTDNTVKTERLDRTA
jgi:hypothetical protein